ncbi:MAG: hypothetical protein J2P27_15900 [Actinobacteria bacterium]|nr:hypothetical protein [Actinomycetota bacterium]
MAITLTAAMGTAAASAATSAPAASTVSIINPNSDGSYTAVSDSTSFYDLNIDLGFYCTPTSAQPYGVEASGTINSVSMQPLPYTIPDAITSLLFNSDGGCTVDGLTVTATAGASPANPYTLTIVDSPGKNSDGDPADADGYITIPPSNPVSVSFGVAPNSCSFTVSGDAPGWYENSDSTLHMAPDVPGVSNTLTIGNVSGALCAALGMADADTGAFWATDEELDTLGLATDPFVVTPAIQIRNP